MLGEKVNLGRESGISSICGEKYISYLIYNIRKKKPFGKCTSKEIINTYDVFLCIVYSHTNKPHVGLKKKKKKTNKPHATSPSGPVDPHESSLLSFSFLSFGKKKNTSTSSNSTQVLC